MRKEDEMDFKRKQYERDTRMNFYENELLREMERQKLIEFMLIFGADFEEIKYLSYGELMEISAPYISEMYQNVVMDQKGFLSGEFEEDEWDEEDE